MSLRLFAALPVPEDLSQRLKALQRGVAGASWRPAENFHITLRFFGAVDETRARALDDELAQIAMAPFEWSLSGAGWFGGAQPTALWIGIDAPEGLTALAQHCERAARRVGLPAEKRRFTPHVTLAYCHGTPAAGAAKFAERLGLFRAGPAIADRFHLYSSWLGKGPSRYVDEAEYPLMG